MTVKGVLLVAAVVTMAMSAGCETTSDWLRGRHTAEAAPANLDEPQTSSYLAELYELASGDPATQAEIFADAESAATITPNPSTRMRYALVLATAGHAATDAIKAQSMFRELLARTELLTPTEIALATIHLRDVEERLTLDAETRRLRSETSRAATTEAAAVARRIANVEAENRQLARSLADAEAKLEALLAVERTLRGQSGNNDFD
jgi:hypothetical protein